MVKVFLTQLDEKVTAGFQKAVSGYDAYQVDRGALTDMKQPPLKVCQKAFFSFLSLHPTVGLTRHGEISRACV